MIQINRNALKAVSLFQGDRDIRYYLCGVYVQATAAETRLVATDGHTLALCDKPAENDQDCAGIIIPDTAIKVILAWKAPVKVDMPVTLTEGENSEWRAQWFGNVAVFKPIDGKYPDYLRVIPSALSGEVAQFQVKYLARCQKACEVFNTKDLAVIGHNGNGSALVDIGEPGFVAVLMPFRAHKLVNVEAFAWARVPLAAAVEKQAEVTA